MVAVPGMDPGMDLADLPANCPSWEGGTAGIDQLQRLVPRADPVDVTVTATCGTASENARIVVRRVDPANTVTAITGDPTINDPDAGNNCTPDAAVDLEWHPGYDETSDTWIVRVDSLTTTGTINIHHFANQPNTMTVPNTPNPVDGGNINNTPGSLNRWSYAISDLSNYDTAGTGGAGPHWHDTVASRAHEMHHWNTDWLQTSWGAAGGDWAQCEQDLEDLSVDAGTHLTEADARAALQAQVDNTMNACRIAAITHWNTVIAPTDSPGAGGGGYAAGAAVLAGHIAAIEAYRQAQGW